MVAEDKNGSNAKEKDNTESFKSHTYQSNILKSPLYHEY